MSWVIFNVIRLAGTFLPLLARGFDYHFDAIQNEDNELFHAYNDMFEIAVSQPGMLRKAVKIYQDIYAPILPVERLFIRPLSQASHVLLTPHQPDEATLAVRKGQETIHRVARRVTQVKEQKIQEGEDSGKVYDG